MSAPKLSKKASTDPCRYLPWLTVGGSPATFQLTSRIVSAPVTTKVADGDRLPGAGEPGSEFLSKTSRDLQRVPAHVNFSVFESTRWYGTAQEMSCSHDAGRCAGGVEKSPPKSPPPLSPRGKASLPQSQNLATYFKKKSICGVGNILLTAYTRGIRILWPILRRTLLTKQQHLLIRAILKCILL